MKWLGLNYNAEFILFFLFQGFILKLFSVFKQLCLFQYKYLCTYKMLTVFY